MRNTVAIVSHFSLSGSTEENVASGYSCPFVVVFFFCLLRMRRLMWPIGRLALFHKTIQKCAFVYFHSSQWIHSATAWYQPNISSLSAMLNPGEKNNRLTPVTVATTVKDVYTKAWLFSSYYAKGLRCSALLISTLQSGSFCFWGGAGLPHANAKQSYHCYDDPWRS